MINEEEYKNNQEIMITNSLTFENQIENLIVDKKQTLLILTPNNLNLNKDESNNILKHTSLKDFLFLNKFYLVHSMKINHAPDCPCVILNNTYSIEEKLKFYDKTNSKKISLASVGIIVDNANKVLLTRRNKNLSLFPNKWVFPGGRVDPKESFLTALLREIHEEVGLEINSKKQIIEGSELNEYYLKQDYDNKEKSEIKVIVSHLNFYESVFYPTLEEGEPRSQHIIVFYILKVEETNEKIDLILQPGEVDAYIWFDSDQLKNLINENKEENIEGYQLNYDSNKFSKGNFGVNIFKNMSMGHKLGLIDFLNSK